MLSPLRFAVLGYTIGAIPLPYLAARVFAGQDLRKMGTATVGASNLSHTRAGWAVAPVGVLQIVQGALPPLLARRAGEGAGVQVIAGLASICGQDWNVFLGFRGGRGVTHSLGFLLALSPPSLACLTVCGLTGVATRRIPAGMAGGLIASPLVASLAGRPPATVRGCGLMALLALVKRAFGNGQPMPDGQSRAETLRNRLLFDRDVRAREAWIARGGIDSDFDPPGGDSYTNP
jgi:glycerol-3-phosphate acyltransferase PlsY